MSRAIDIARGRVQRVLEFLKRFQSLKTPPVRNVSEYKWRLHLDRLPKHSSIHLGQVARATGDNNIGTVDGIILKVTRPSLTECPHPPESLRPWLIPGWNRIDERPQFLEARNEEIGPSTRTIRFDADQTRIQAWDEWIVRRIQWEAAERPARDAEATYQ